MRSRQFLTIFLSMALAAVASNAACGAEQESTPFQLKARKTYVQGGSGNSPQPGLRLPRPQLEAGATQNAGQNSVRLQSLQGVRDNRHHLRTDDWLLPGQARSDVLQGLLTVQTLSNFDLEIIVDQSLSMRRRDCPGELSRWNWCGSQLRELSTQLSPYVPNGFTLTTFNTEFETFQNAQPRHLSALFANPKFAGGTRLSRPIRAHLNEYFARRKPGTKPLLLMVITDGVPHPAREPDLVADTLIAASQRLKNANEITVVFFQIGGNDRVGRYFLHQLDTSLIRLGARYDIVQTVPFEELERYGLIGSLLNCLRQHAGRN